MRANFKEIFSCCGMHRVRTNYKSCNIMPLKRSSLEFHFPCFPYEHFAREHAFGFQSSLEKYFLGKQVEFSPFLVKDVKC